MRSAGTVVSARGLGLHDHLCWSYDTLEEFRLHAREFLGEGLDLGQRVVYVGAAPVDELRAGMLRSPAFADLSEGEGFHLASLGATYRSGSVVDPADQVAAYAVATQRALDAGFAGLRVAAEATAVVRTPVQRAAFARYEHLIDRFMTVQPFAAMCGYDRIELGRPGLTEIASMHPVVRDGDAPFRLYAGSGGGLALAGEVEQFDEALFARSLERAVHEVAGGVLVVDASELRFVDHHGLLVLDDAAAVADAVVELRGAARVVARVIEVLGLERVRVVDPR